ncbi:hypothetical protein QSV08_07815 [Maribacter sp. BPC-D8]|uniref:hypothetical protein n=1 Tax=Maribacter sp. BPC-D8 TaxID=3053613 RepID=UPI002B489765|nr:hypothetical protein [Maribacter sp. BPC-D8]WRI31151.1 hypothetical protein QSV08_07815 [Maribacter sp. BPC-D8]
MNQYFKIALLILVISPISSFSQNKIKDKIDSLLYVEEMPYICEEYTKCGHELFWNVVKLKEKGIPFLIEKLNDSTETNAGVVLFGGNYAVADIAYVALEEIIHGIPTFELLGTKFDQEGCGYCEYWYFLRKDYQNRQNFKLAVKNWFDKNKKDLVWVSNNEFSSCDCSGKHPNEGHYEMKKK